VRLEILTVIKIQVVVFWIMTPHSEVVGYQHFWGPCCLHIHFILKWRQHGPQKWCHNPEDPNLKFLKNQSKNTKCNRTCFYRT